MFLCILNQHTLAWLSYLNVAVLMGTLAAALFNASKDDIARKFAYTYALISLAVLSYGYVLYQKVCI